MTEDVLDVAGVVLHLAVFKVTHIHVIAPVDVVVEWVHPRFGIRGVQRMQVGSFARPVFDARHVRGLLRHGGVLEVVVVLAMDVVCLL